MWTVLTWTFGFLTSNALSDANAENYSKKDKELIEALKQELKHYELYKKADRAKQVKEAIKKAGGSVETKTAKPKAEKKVEKKK